MADILEFPKTEEHVYAVVTPPERDTDPLFKEFLTSLGVTELQAFTGWKGTIPTLLSSRRQQRMISLIHLVNPDMVLNTEYFVRTTTAGLFPIKTLTHRILVYQDQGNIFPGTQHIMEDAHTKIGDFFSYCSAHHPATLIDILLKEDLPDSLHRTEQEIRDLYVCFGIETSDEAFTIVFSEPSGPYLAEKVDDIYQARTQPDSSGPFATSPDASADPHEQNDTPTT